jgi:hypothetical protein
MKTASPPEPKGPAIPDGSERTKVRHNNPIEKRAARVKKELEDAIAKSK